MAYVYGHYKADTGELFYIGKGTGNRAWIRWGRSTYWNRIVSKHGLVIKILEDGLTEDEAFEKETRLIEEVGLTNLANIREGGLGNTSESAKKLWDDPEFRKKAMARKQDICKFHNEIYQFPNGKRTCRVCFRDSVKAWRHSNGVTPRGKCDCSYCKTLR